MEENLYESLNKEGTLLKVGDFTFLNQEVSYYTVRIQNDELLNKVKQSYPNHEQSNAKEVLILDDEYRLFYIHQSIESEKIIESRKKLYRNEGYLLELQEAFNEITEISDFFKSTQIPKLVLKYNSYFRNHYYKRVLKMCLIVALCLGLLLFVGFEFMMRSFFASTGLELRPIWSNLKEISKIIWVIGFIALFIPPVIFKKKIAGAKLSTSKRRVIVISLVVVGVGASLLFRANFIIKTTPRVIVDKKVTEVEYLDGTKKKFMMVDSFWMQHAGKGFDS
ncbi:MAG: hypothetical protein RR565_07725 [Erysipelothrix sp.]